MLVRCLQHKRLLPAGNGIVVLIATIGLHTSVFSFLLCGLLGLLLRLFRSFLSILLVDIHCFSLDNLAIRLVNSRILDVHQLAVLVDEKRGSRLDYAWHV